MSIPKNLFEAADAYNVTYGIGTTIPAFADIARGLVSKEGTLQLAADDLPLSLSNLLASAGAADKIATLITGTDLTVAGTLTTLTTNVGTNTTEGAALAAALLALTNPGDLAAAIAADADAVATILAATPPGDLVAAIAADETALAALKTALGIAE